MPTIFAAALLAGLLTLPAPALAVGEEILIERLHYCAEAIAAGDPAGPVTPGGLTVSDKGAVETGGKVHHLAMRRDGRGDWVCELGEKSARVLTRAAEDFLRKSRTVDKTRSTYGGNRYITATICIGPNAVAMILNGPLTQEMGMGTAVFTGGAVNSGCGG